jgi:hypothetical protein
MDWDTEVNLLATDAMHTMADVMHAGIVLSDEDIHTMRLVPIGGIDVRGIRPATFWIVPTGAEGEPSHQEDCPVCGDHEASSVDEWGIPF